MITGFSGSPFFLSRICSAGRASGKAFRLSLLFANSRPVFLNNTSIKTRGYTLLELIVVIVLLGLMFGIAVPRFRQAMLNDSLDATSLRIIGLIQNLRERAISDQASYVLHFDIPGGKLWSFAVDATEEEQETAKERAYQLPADIDIEDIWAWSSGKLYDEAKINFSKKGYIEQAVIHLQSEDGRQLSLELTPFLGSIKIHEGYIDLGRS